MNDNPRIVLLMSQFYPVVGGAESHALLLGQEFIRRGIGLFVITRRIARSLKKEEDVTGIRVIRVLPWGFRRLGKYLMLPAVLLQLLRRRGDYDIIVVSGLRILGIAGMLGAKWLDKSCVLRAASCGELSGDFIWDSPHKAVIRSRFARWMVRRLLAVRDHLLLRADGFLAISKAIQEEYIQCGVPKEKTRVINNGTDTSVFKPADHATCRRLRKQLELPSTGMLFAYTGKLNRGKGLEFLLSVWEPFCRQHPDTHLVLVGSGGSQFLDCEQDLRDFVQRHDMNTAVTFTGYVTNVADYLRASDVVVFPSENESLSNALIEALACGLPCLASNVGGIPDTVRDGVNGRLLAPGDSNTWLRALEDVVSDHSLIELWGRQGRERIMERNSMAAVADAHLDFFREISPKLINRD